MEDQAVQQVIEEAFGSLLEEHIYLLINGVPYEVVELKGREKVSELFRFDIVCDEENQGVPPFELLGAHAIMVMYDGFENRRTLQGVIASAKRNVRDSGDAELRVELRPNVYPLSLGRDSRVFNHMTVPQIVDRVMERTARLSQDVPYRWELSRSYRERVYTAQYREDDWTFVSRLLEEEGIYYWFDHEAAETVIVFGDDSTHAARLVGAKPIEFVFETGMLGDKEMIHELASEAHATATKFTVGSFNPWNPALKVVATEGDGIHEMYDAPGGGPESPEVCRHQARNRLECALSHRHSYSGNSSSVRITPGRILDVVGHPLHDGAYFVTEVTYDVSQRRRFTEEEHGGYVCHFEGIPAAVTFRPPEDTPVSKQAGIQSGRVTGPPGEEIHTDERGRVRVQLHWDREGGWDDKAGKWMRISQRGVNNSMLFPRVGWNVMTFMQEGNVNAPGVLARVHDAEHPPTYKLPDNKTRTVYRTETSPGGGSANELRYEDLAGIQEFFMNASKDMNYTVENNNGYEVGNNNAKRVGGNQQVNIESRLMQNVQHDQSMSITGEEQLEVKDNRDKVVAGNETRDIQGKRKLKIGSNVVHNVVKKRTLTVTGDCKETAKEGLIKQSALTATIKVTGEVKIKNDGNNNEDVGKGCTKTITDNKTEKCKEGFMMEVNDNWTETLEQNLKMKSDKDFMCGSDEKSLWDVTGNMTGAAKKRVQIQAKEKITLMCGSSKIEITKTEIKISASTYEKGGASTKAVAKQINQNRK